MTKKEMQIISNKENGLLKDLKTHELAELLNLYENKPIELITTAYMLGKIRARKVK